MVDPEWQGGKKEQRLYRKVRAEKQKVIRKKYDVIQAHLNERGRRLWAGSEAISFGQGGIRAVAEALAMSQKTVIQGRRELEGKSPGKPGEGVLTGGRQRRAGGGRKPAVERQPGLVEAIETIVNPATRGDPMRPLKWTSKSRRKISTELQRQGWQVSAKTVGKILRGKLDYSLQGLQKTREGASHPDRDAQFQYLNQQCQDFQHRGQPGFSVDADGRRGLSAGSRVAHHGRCRRQQRLPNQVVETGAAAAGRRNGSGDHGLSLSARNQQVE